MSTAAYVDLMFAWAHARLGDAETAQSLRDGALDPLMATADRAHEWIATAFGHRIGQALAGQAHCGEWPTALTGSLSQLDEDRTGPSRLFVANQFRRSSRILEPDVRVDPYVGWLRHGNQFQRSVAELEATSDPDSFTTQFQSLLADTDDDERLRQRLSVLRTAADAGSRVPGVVAEVVFRETLQVFDSLLQSTLKPRNAEERQTLEDLVRDLSQAVSALAVVRKEYDFVVRVVSRLANWYRHGDHQSGALMGSTLTQTLVGPLYQLNLAADAALLLDVIAETNQSAVAALTSPDTPAVQLMFAGCRRWLGLPTEAVFEQVRASLFAEPPQRLKPLQLAQLAQAYLLALGMGPIASSAPSLLELFVRLPSIPTGYTTATHFSRLHVDVADAAILAVTTPDFSSVSELHARLGRDEVAIRRELLPALRERLIAWGRQGW